MAAKKPNPGMEFILNTLKSNRNAVYADTAEAAAKKKLKIYPIMWGRAQALLGIVKMAPRGQGKMARKKAGLPPKRGPGRPRKNAASGTGGYQAIEGILAAVKGSEQEKARFRGALEKIQSILADALG